MLRSIRIENLLSFGSAPEGEFQFGDLNVLIGPNASGKSNLIEILSLLAAAPGDLQIPVRQGGGVGDWLWKGAKAPVASLSVAVHHPHGPQPLRYRLAFTEVGGRFSLVDEAIEDVQARPGAEKPDFYYQFQDGSPVLTAFLEGYDRLERRLRRDDASPSQSILSQRRDPDTYPELTYLASQFEQMRFYREWNLGRFTPPRLPQKTDLPEGALLEDAANLGLVLNDLQHRPDVKRAILTNLQRCCQRVTDLTTKIHGGAVQIFLHEEGLSQPVPATRLSDGTLRFLCLLAILCHPSPPPLVCIEEPELGLHPDLVPTIADLLQQAAQRTQLVVTTHSDVLVDALTDRPDAVVVCERGEGGTTLRRLDPVELGPWLAKYRLGELWTRGEIGGTRW